MEAKTQKKARTPFLQIPAVQTLGASLLCVLFGLLAGFIVLVIIQPGTNPETGKMYAVEAIVAVMKNFFKFNSAATQLKNFGNTLVKTAPLLMCSLSILFAYKVGLFNIGAAGQYVVGIGASLYMALACQLPWYICLLGAAVAGGVWGMISGMLKAYCHVNEVISCIMLNWIGLYSVNTLLSNVKESSSPYTLKLKANAPNALLPTLGLDTLFGNKYVTIAIPLAIVIAILVWVVLNKTKLGYELKATGLNKNAAKYCGMREKYNTILTMTIAGALAGLGAGMLYLSGFEEWSCTQTSVPAMGFNGIAAAFLGGLHPIGSIFASFFIQHITIGGSYVDKTVYCSQISDFISAVIIYSCGFVLFIKQNAQRIRARRIERSSQLTKGGEA
jgi:general nucleoside transport system permease protein